MQNTIFECYEFHELKEYPEKYMPLIESINENYSMDIIKIYESNLSEGLFIHIKLKISIPTNGVYRELDVNPNEEILMYARTDYPFSAPAILFVRNDFPVDRIPHLNNGVPDSNIQMMNPCLYRGDINEWFYENGPMAFCDRVNDWFSDLVNGELINDDGFETVRYENISGFVEIDFDYLLNIISTYKQDCGDCVIGMKKKGEQCFEVLNLQYDKGLDKNILPCIFVFDRKNVISDYISQPFYKEKDLKNFPCESRIQHGIRKMENKFYERKKLDELKDILIIMAVKRPMQVIGGFSEYEFIAVLLSYKLKSSADIKNCLVQKVVTIQSLNKQMTERLSGTENISKRPINILGCGALGSKISMNLARMGYTEQHLYDKDIILPHNLVRHYVSKRAAIGFPKARIMKIEMDCMFTNNSSSHFENIFDIEILPDGLTVDCTASKRSLFWSLSREIIKSPMLRTEIYLGGKMGLSLFEGKNRNPDIYDMQVSLYLKALKEDIISKWLTYKQPEDMRYHIGFGCNSDTMVLDDATISNHASVVPHLINKYKVEENGIACINIFDFDNLSNNRLYIYEIEPMVFLSSVDGWHIHIKRSLYQKIKEYSKEGTENAGIWIGCIEKRIKRITVIDTFIPKDNKRDTNSVVIGKEGVKEYIRSLNERTNGLLRYIGEWHTHTSGNASPSQRDIKSFEETKVSTDGFLMTIISPTNTQNYIIKGKNNEYKRL
ncbi:ThiF family adenylyltransferase [Intestinibacter bartlettii]|uniref:ThiF family adenylyltransferase n=1 Tax=Intestinibacter bartlettii TaxID=261299 RepID=UPI00241EC6F1|nr:ThiF family adenylyltransferase [Intestinibacter bartlettii]